MKGIYVFDDFNSRLNVDSNIEIFCLLKKGDFVLFYENSPDEIYWNDSKDLSRRLYYANDIAGNDDKRIKFRHHLEARNDDKLREYYKDKLGEHFEKTIVTGRSKFSLIEYYPKLNISKSNFNFLVINKHFKIKEDGTIIKL